MKKRVLSVLLCAVMAVSLLAGCGSGNSDNGGESESDKAYVQDKGTLVVGITNFEPMDYKDESGEWVGFDADLARKFAESLGVEAEFVEIDWDNKIMELDGTTIDCVWNGMTLTPEVTSSMECTDAYLNNAQVVVVPKEVADQYQDEESLVLHNNQGFAAIPPPCSIDMQHISKPVKPPHLQSSTRPFSAVIK